MTPQNLKNLKKASGVTFTTSLAFFTFACSDSQCKKVAPVPDWVFQALIIQAAYYLLAATITLLLSVIIPKLEKSPPTYITKPLKRSELGELYQFLVENLGQDVLSERGMREFYNKNPEIFWGIYEVREKFTGSTQRLIGHFSLGPINTVARKALLEGRLKGKDLTVDHISTRRQAPAAFYLGAIVAVNTKKAKAETFETAMGHIFTATRRTNTVITRPTTDDGLRLAKKYGFTSISNGSEIKIGDICVKQFTPSEKRT